MQSYLSILFSNYPYGIHTKIQLKYSVAPHNVGQLLKSALMISANYQNVGPTQISRKYYANMENTMNFQSRNLEIAPIDFSNQNIDVKLHTYKYKHALNRI
jgi:hypothetical protein